MEGAAGGRRNMKGRKDQSFADIDSTSALPRHEKGAWLIERENTGPQGGGGKTGGGKEGQWAKGIGKKWRG